MNVILCIIMSYYIYKICCDNLPDFVYVGSTKAFWQRKAHHKHDCYNENRQSYNNKLYSTIRANGGWDNWRMVIIEDCGEISFTQARIKEEEHRMKLNANLNSHKCYITEEMVKENDKKYYEINKEKKIEYQKEYRENNKEAIEEKQGQKMTCECGGSFRIDNKARHEKTEKHCEFIKNNLE